MINVICGKKGSGKTKKLIDSANDCVQKSKGSVVFMDDNNRYMYDLHRDIRFVDTSQYKIGNAERFIGFILGISSQNFDIEAMYIDAFLRHTGLEPKELEQVMQKLEKIGEGFNMDIYISLSSDPEELPEFFSKYNIMKSYL